MAIFSKKFYVGRRRIRLAGYLILTGLCSATIVYLIQNAKNITEKSVFEDRPEEPIAANTLGDDLNKNDYYVAAVIDYYVLLRNDLISTWEANIQNYVDIISECGKLNVDIVVFPETGIYGYFPVNRQTGLLTSSYVPSSKSFVVPCTHRDYIESPLRHLSCAANRNNIYVAVNLIEKVHSDKWFVWGGHLLYITEVVLDRKGMVVARYRKFNLYTEQWIYGLSTTNDPELVTFVTDFGVEFGILICFDVYFTKPAVILAEEQNITHFIHSSAMMSRLPFLPASAVESGWSYALDVIVLSSSFAMSEHTIGTNVFFGRRPGTRTYTKPFRQSNLIISPVPKFRHLPTPKYPEKFLSLTPYIPGRIRQTSFLKEHVLDRMTTQVLPSDHRNQATFAYTSSTFECNITASWRHSDLAPNYQFIAYSGLNNYSLAATNRYVEICGLTLCSSNSSVSCQQPPRFEDVSGSIFTSLDISARSTNVDSLRIPAAFDFNLVALDSSGFQFGSRLENYLGRVVYRVNMGLKRPINGLQTFSVYQFGWKSDAAGYFNPLDYSMNMDTI